MADKESDVLKKAVKHWKENLETHLILGVDINSDVYAESFCKAAQAELDFLFSPQETGSE